MNKENIDLAPSLEEWKQLYEAAMCFKEESPWEWMWDSDIFGVRNPLDGDIGYCCILGKLGEVLGMAVYLGTEGLEGFLKMLNGEITAGDDDIMHANKCLFVSFEEKSGLEKADKEIISNLGLEFKGKNAWPLFRNYSPGYFPWYLNKVETVFLAHCLRQARDVALRYKENPSLFDAREEDNYLVRVCDTARPEAGWKDSWLAPLPFKKVVMISKKLEERRQENIIKTAVRRSQTWEADFFYSPAYIAEKDRRPYYPLTLIFVDSVSFFILNAHVTTIDKYRMEFDEKLLETIERAKVIPEEILVNKEELAFLLGQAAERLGIKVRLVNKIPAAADVRKEMFKAFTKNAVD